jgi:hypothetical protein
MSIANAGERIAELERRLADAQARLPKHSTPVVQMIEIEELEEALAEARADACPAPTQQEKGHAPSHG